MNKINLKNIKNKNVENLVKKVMDEHNLKRVKITIRVGGGNPDIVFSKKSKDYFSSNGKSFFWDEIIRSYDTDSRYQHDNAITLWEEFFNDVSHFERYRIEEVVVYR